MRINYYDFYKKLSQEQERDILEQYNMEYNAGASCSLERVPIARLVGMNATCAEIKALISDISQRNFDPIKDELLEPVGKDFTAADVIEVRVGRVFDSYRMISDTPDSKSYLRSIGSVRAMGIISSTGNVSENIGVLLGYFNDKADPIEDRDVLTISQLFVHKAGLEEDGRAPNSLKIMPQHRQLKAMLKMGF